MTEWRADSVVVSVKAGWVTPF